MAAFQFVVWTCLVGILAFFVHRELQVTTTKLSEEMFMHAKRSDVYSVLSDPQLISDVHPLATGVSNVDKRKTEDGYDEIHSVIHETFNFLGFYEKSVDINLVQRETQRQVRLEMTGELSTGMLKIKQSFLLVDYKEGDKEGILVIDKAEYTGIRFFANYALVEAIAAHQEILRKVKEYVENSA